MNIVKRTVCAALVGVAAALIAAGMTVGTSGAAATPADRISASYEAYPPPPPSISPSCVPDGYHRCPSPHPSHSCKPGGHYHPCASPSASWSPGPTSSATSAQPSWGVPLPSDTPKAGGGSLPRTGWPVGWLAFGGLLALLVGGAVVLVGLRHRSGES